MFRVHKTPNLSILLDDLFSKDPVFIAKHLGVNVRTLKRWIRTGEAPRMALLALFYESRWGYSLLECEAHNRAQLAQALADGLARENAGLRLRITRLEAIGDFGAANSPCLSKLPGLRTHPVRIVPA